jgi:hypothetical protein
MPPDGTIRKHARRFTHMAIADLMPGVLRYVQISSAMAKKALDQLAIHQQREKAATDLIPATVDKLIATGTIEPHQKEAVAKMLANPSQTLQLLQNASEKLAEYQVKLTKKAKAQLGQGTDEDPTKEAGDLETAVMSPYVGARRSEKTAADHALFKGLGLQSD